MQGQHVPGTDHFQEDYDGGILGKKRMKRYSNLCYFPGAQVSGKIWHCPYSPIQQNYMSPHLY